MVSREVLFVSRRHSTRRTSRAVAKVSLIIMLGLIGSLVGPHVRVASATTSPSVEWFGTVQTVYSYSSKRYVKGITSTDWSSAQKCTPSPPDCVERKENLRIDSMHQVSISSNGHSTLTVFYNVHSEDRIWDNRGYYCDITDEQTINESQDMDGGTFLIDSNDDGTVHVGGPPWGSFVEVSVNRIHADSCEGTHTTTLRMTQYFESIFRTFPTTQWPDGSSGLSQLHRNMVQSRSTRPPDLSRWDTDLEKVSVVDTYDLTKRPGWDEQPLIIKAVQPKCPNETVRFETVSKPKGAVSWIAKDGTPTSTISPTFTTRFPTPGKHIVVASAAGQVALTEVTISRESGKWWTASKTDPFPGSKVVDDLDYPFRGNVQLFLDALRGAGVNPETSTNVKNSYRISATKRPPQRAYLMYHAKAIVEKTIKPGVVPRYKVDTKKFPTWNPNDPYYATLVDICWEHKNPDGTPDVSASLQAAKVMSDTYKVGNNPVAQDSNHIPGHAIDIKIRWTGNLTVTCGPEATAGTICDNAGKIVTITTTPRTGGDKEHPNGNKQLREVGASYGVIKLVSSNKPDPPHWSIDGH